MGISSSPVRTENYKNHLIEHSDDLINLYIILNENLRLFYMGYIRKLCKNCAKI